MNTNNSITVTGVNNYDEEGMSRCGLPICGNGCLGSFFLWLNFIYVDILTCFVPGIKCEKALMAYGILYQCK
jgi:hypothetical protein